MTITLTHALRLPIVLIIGIGLFTFVIGKKGFNETIDAIQDVSKRFLIDDENVGADEAPETIQEGELIPVTFEAESSQGNITIFVRDELGNPVGDVCLILQNNGATQVDMKFTSFNEGKAVLNFKANGTPLILLVDPQNHTLNTPVNEGAYSFNAGTTISGRSFCFKQIRSAQGVSYELLDDCIQAEPLDPYPAPLDDAELDKESNQGNSPREENTPLTFEESFDNPNDFWELNDELTRTESIEGGVFVKNGSLVFQQIFTNDFKMYRTEIPIPRGVQDFTFKAELRSESQPSAEGELGRFNFQFRVQEDGRYYNLAIDHTGVTTLFYARYENGEQVWTKIDEFHLTGYQMEEGALNKLFVSASGNRFAVNIEGQEPRVMIDQMQFINQRGGMSLSVDGSADNIVSYELDYLMVHELLGE